MQHRHTIITTYMADNGKKIIMGMISTNVSHMVALTVAGCWVANIACRIIEKMVLATSKTKREHPM